MPAVKRPVVPAKDEDLKPWLCASPAHLEEFLAVEGEQWVALAKSRVRQVFSRSDDAVACHVAWAALALLSDRVRSGRLSEVQRVRPWLNAVVTNLTREAFRDFIRHKRVLDVDPEHFAVEHEEPVDPQESAVVIGKVHECMKTLSAGEQNVVGAMMVDPDNPPEPKDIAAALGISPVSVRVQLSSGRDKLKKCLATKGVQL